MGYIIILLFLGYVCAFSIALLWQLTSFIASRFRKPSLEAFRFDDETPTEVVVTLVHGTWARQAPWTSPGSPLCEGIRAAHPDRRVAFIPFPWSGRNTISARYRASVSLAAALEATAAKWPRARHLVVGHSHGGSVALAALRHRHMHHRIDGVVCLSTPFLIARRRPDTTLSRIGLTLSPAWLAFVASGVVLSWSGLGSLVDRHEALKAVVAGAVLGVAFLALSRTRRIVERLASVMSERMALSDLAPEKLLIIRVAGDEASAALGMMQILNFAVRQLWEQPAALLEATALTLDRWGTRLDKFGPALHVLYAALVAAAIAASFDALPFGIRLPQEMAVVMVLVAVVLWAVQLRNGIPAMVGLLVCGLLVAPLPVLLAGLLVPFGPELATVSLLLDVSAEPAPAGNWTLRQFAARSPDSAETADNSPLLAHSTPYQRTEIVREVASWIRQRVVA